MQRWRKKGVFGTINVLFRQSTSFNVGFSNNSALKPLLGALDRKVPYCRSLREDLTTNSIRAAHKMWTGFTPLHSHDTAKHFIATTSLARTPSPCVSFFSILPPHRLTRHSLVLSKMFPTFQENADWFLTVEKVLRTYVERRLKYSKVCTICWNIRQLIFAWHVAKFRLCHFLMHRRSRCCQVSSNLYGAVLCLASMMARKWHKIR